MKSHSGFNPRQLPTQTRVERAAAPYLVSRFVFVFPESRLLASVWNVCFSSFFFLFFPSGWGSDPGPTLPAVSFGERRLQLARSRRVLPLRCNILGIFSPFSSMWTEERRCVFPFHHRAKQREKNVTFKRVKAASGVVLGWRKKTLNKRKGGDCRHLFKGAMNEEQICDSPPPPPPPRGAIQASPTDQISWQIYVNELNHPDFASFFPPPPPQTVCCLPFHPALHHQTVQFQFSLDLNPPRCAFPSKDSTSFFYSLSSPSSFFHLASSFRSKWYLMCKEERQ